jgi:hypothetical protein
MSNFTLAPEEDDPIASGDIRSTRNAAKPTQPTEMQRIGYQLNLSITGFELLPWPGVKQTDEPGDNVAIAMRYLIEGTHRRS